MCENVCNDVKNVYKSVFELPYQHPLGFLKIKKMFSKYT